MRVLFAEDRILWLVNFEVGYRSEVAIKQTVEIAPFMILYIYFFYILLEKHTQRERVISLLTPYRKQRTIGRIKIELKALNLEEKKG